MDCRGDDFLTRVCVELDPVQTHHFNMDMYWCKSTIKSNTPEVILSLLVTTVRICRPFIFRHIMDCRGDYFLTRVCVEFDPVQTL